LKKLIGIDASIDIITKSKLVTRDIDLLKQIKHINVTSSFCANNEQIKKLFEHDSPPIEERKQSLKTLHENGITTTLFISPILPEVTDWKSIINETKDYVDEYWFENLNLYSSIKKDIYEIVAKINSDLPARYKEIYEGGQYEEYRDHVESDIQQFCLENKITYKMYFHHKDNKK
jgi:DNA repair photolyase